MSKSAEITTTVPTRDLVVSMVGKNTQNATDCCGGGDIYAWGS